jgi:hypothetical protein
VVIRQVLEAHLDTSSSPPPARALVPRVLPITTNRDLTALWEAAMRRIADDHMPLDKFVAAVLAQLEELIIAGRRTRPSTSRPPNAIPSLVPGAAASSAAAPVEKARSCFEGGGGPITGVRDRIGGGRSMRAGRSAYEVAAHGG